MDKRILNVLWVACLIGLSLMVGCSSARGGTAKGGLATSLEPSQLLEIVTTGEKAQVSLVNDGPGSVSLTFADGPGNTRVEIPLGPRGSTRQQAPKDGTMRVVNQSTEKATVHVDVSGAESLYIIGPTVK